jgi:2-haloacid dehalogenase
MADFDFGRFEVLTFDCYGTLIDWETGITSALRTALGSPARDLDDEDQLAAFAMHEAAAESGRYLP